jgi:hypothetical protein
MSSQIIPLKDRTDLRESSRIWATETIRELRRCVIRSSCFAVTAKLIVGKQLHVQPAVGFLLDCLGGLAGTHVERVSFRNVGAPLESRR